MKKFILLTILTLGISFQVLAWGHMGHDVVAYIGEKNLTRRAEKRVRELLDGHSLVYYAAWLDNASNTPEYAYTATWHYRNVDKGETLESMPLNENGDVVRATEDLVKQIKSGELSREQEKVALMMIIHLVGDMHCPMHAGRLSDLGGNRREVTFFGHSTNLHSVWDSKLIESAHKWSYSGWWEQLDILDKKSKAAIMRGEPIEWFSESVEAAAKIYEATPENSKLSYDYVSQFAPLAEQQLLKGGLRLAYILNELYN